ncbi:ATP-dependent DNA helicase PIF1-like, partial [Paramuricea clavata]
MNKLINLPGDIYVYDAIDTASENTLNKVTLAKSQLKLKIGAEVMLLYNISEKLKNGTRGKVVQLEKDGPTVDFKDVGIVTKLHRCTWFAYKSGMKDVIVGQRSQFPLILAWGITAHKAQGQTLKAAVVHSGNEFLPGQLYVACSRVSTKEGLHIVNFNPKKLIKEDSRVGVFYSSLSDCPPLPDLSCCVCSCVDEVLQDHIETDVFINSESLSETDLDRIEKVCSELFVEAEEQEHVNLEDYIDSNDVFSSVTSENTEQEKKLPNDFNVFDFLETLKDKTKL